jgi:hypothetical protein
MRGSYSYIFSAIPLVALLLTPVPGAAQDPADEEPVEAPEVEVDQIVVGRPNIFFDCAGRNCNSSYYRTEIDWVNWVRDREVADIHIIMTSLPTGAGGREYQLDFIGEDDFADYEDQIFYTALATDTDREQLDGITATLSAGLARFAAEAGFLGIVAFEGTEIEGGGPDPSSGLVSQAEVNDPWNLWTFRISGTGNLSGEDTRKTIRLFGNLSASRVTPTWKMSFGSNVSYNRRENDIMPSEGDPYTFIDERTDWAFTQLVVYSLAQHWSVGFRSEVRRQNTTNQRLRLEFMPGLEYSFFPYEEATRRSLTAFYTVGPARQEYFEETIYGHLEETRFQHALELELSGRQPWGDASVSAELSQYLHDADLYNVALEGDIDVRIVRGLSVNAGAEVSWVNDQIYLAADPGSTEEQLLNLVRQAQSFTYQLQAGISIQFGSIYNNVVNNRFSGGGGGFGGGGGGRRGGGDFF